MKDPLNPRSLSPYSFSFFLRVLSVVFVLVSVFLLLFHQKHPQNAQPQHVSNITIHTMISSKTMTIMTIHKIGNAPFLSSSSSSTAVTITFEFGAAVGVIVGTMDGVAVGYPVGSMVGSAVGSVVGSIVGDAVGSSVGNKRINGR